MVIQDCIHACRNYAFDVTSGLTGFNSVAFDVRIYSIYIISTVYGLRYMLIIGISFQWDRKIRNYSYILIHQYKPVCHSHCVLYLQSSCLTLWGLVKLSGFNMLCNLMHEGFA